MRMIGRLLFESGIAVGTLATGATCLDSHSYWIGFGFIYASVATYIGGEIYHRHATM